MPTKAPQVHSFSTAETRNISVDFSGKLDTGEALTGTPVVAQVDGGSELTFGAQQVNGSALLINGVSVSAGGAVQFTASSATTGTYEIDITCGTTESQTLEGRIVVVVNE